MNTSYLSNLRAYMLPIIAICVVIGVIGAGVWWYRSRTSQSPHIYRIGIASGFDLFIPTIDSFKTQMAELGYHEGEQVLYDIEYTNVEPERERAIIERFVQEPVDVVVTFPTEISLIAKSIVSGKGIPLVFANAAVEGVSLVDSVAHPGATVTGVRFPAVELTLKRFEIMHAILPHMRHVLVVYQLGYPIVPSQVAALREKTDAAQVALVEISARDLGDLKAQLNAYTGPADAILVMSEPLASSPAGAEVLDAFAHARRIPIGGVLVPNHHTNSLFGVMPDLAETGKLLAQTVDKILHGIPAGTIPVATPESLLTVDYATAQSLNIPIPEDILIQAVSVIR